MLYLDRLAYSECLEIPIYFGICSRKDYSVFLWFDIRGDNILVSTLLDIELAALINLEIVDVIAL